MTTIEKLKQGYTSNSVEETEEIACAFASEIAPDAFICLSGDLGSGKTAFVRGMAKFLDVKTQVKSPSFNICNIYPEGLVHIDAYRISSHFDVDDFLIEELAKDPSFICVEWAENIKDFIPETHYNLVLSIEGEKHIIKLI
ncbi:MAG: tRNA (adenosine(37)-N6)-threonylcarbamoyltransferase complex ATPase subunit type 1 TsaE [Opitutales bacterium]